MTYHWDALNRLREVRDASNSNVLVSYLHTTGNQRVSRTISNGGVPGDTSLNGTTHFYYAGWQLHDEYAANPGESLKYQYVWGPRHPDELICRDDRSDSTTVAHLNDGLAGGAVGGSSGGRQYQHHDRGWNIRSVTDEAGAVQEQYLYDPFGHPFIFAPDGVTQRNVSSTDQAYGFTSQRFDYETGLWYFKHRYLDDGLGRFISRDPAGYVDGMNLYTAYFVMTGTDPLGLWGWDGDWIQYGLGGLLGLQGSEVASAGWGEAAEMAQETKDAVSDGVSELVVQTQYAVGAIDEDTLMSQSNVAQGMEQHYVDGGTDAGVLGKALLSEVSAPVTIPMAAGEKISTGIMNGDLDTFSEGMREGGVTLGRWGR